MWVKFVRLNFFYILNIYRFYFIEYILEILKYRIVIVDLLYYFVDYLRKDLGIIFKKYFILYLLCSVI